jgi:hypothetical protein
MVVQSGVVIGGRLGDDVVEGLLTTATTPNNPNKWTRFFT